MEGPVKLIQWVRIALLFLHVTSKVFHFTILKTFLRSSTKNFPKQFTNKNKITRFLFIESF